MNKLKYIAIWVAVTLFSVTAEGSGTTAISSTVCMSFPVALALAMLPVETIGTVLEHYIKPKRKTTNE